MALPVLEYCNLERASRLLNCEIEDIVHWWLIGVIELHICLNGKKSILVERKKISKNINQFESLRLIINTSASKLSNLYEIEAAKHDHYPENSCYSCTAYGLWKVLPSSITRELKDGKVKLISEHYFKETERKEYLALLSHDNNNFYLIFDKMDTNEGYEIDVKELIITKKYIDRLNPDIYKDAQYLPNWLKENNFDDEKDNETEAAITTTKIRERVSSKHRDAIYILLKETDYYPNDPYMLHNILNSVAEKYGYPKDHFKDDTCANWIKDYKS